MPWHPISDADILFEMPSNCSISSWLLKNEKDFEGERGSSMAGKRVFILGAGASISHSNGTFPSILTFFHTAKELGLASSQPFKRIAKYAATVLGKDLNKDDDYVDVEKFFTYLEIEIERNPAPQLFQLRHDFLYVIQRVLLKSSINIKPADGDYEIFASKLNKKDTIISFNWDLLLDDVLHRKSILKKYLEDEPNGTLTRVQYNNYVTDLSAYGEQTLGNISIHRPYKQWGEERGYLLKLHGSIDWYFCANEACRAYQKVFPLLSPEKVHYCAECHEKIGYLIIPPILNKSYRQYPLIRRIWNLAAKELSIANEIILWGYSLPPTDFYASWLLTQGRHSNLQKLTIINPELINQKTKRGRITFIKKFYDFYRDLMPKSSVSLYEYFDDYAEDKDIFKKFPTTVYSRLLNSV